MVFNVFLNAVSKTYFPSQGLVHEPDQKAHLDIQLEVTTETSPAPPISHEKIISAQAAPKTRSTDYYPH